MKRSCQDVTNVTKGHWCSVALRALSEPKNCHGAGFKLRTDARVRVQEPLQNCLGCRSKSKNCDEQLTHIVRVSVSFGISILFTKQLFIIKFVYYFSTNNIQRANEIHTFLTKELPEQCKE
jgi:hypothetical protein